MRNIAYKYVYTFRLQSYRHRKYGVVTPVVTAFPLNSAESECLAFANNSETMSAKAATFLQVCQKRVVV